MSLPGGRRQKKDCPEGEAVPEGDGSGAEYPILPRKMAAAVSSPCIRRCGAAFPKGGRLGDQLLKTPVLRKKPFIRVVRQRRGFRFGGLFRRICHLPPQMPPQGRQCPAHSATVETAPAVRVSHSAKPSAKASAWSLSQTPRQPTYRCASAFWFVSVMSSSAV